MPGAGGAPGGANVVVVLVPRLSAFIELPEGTFRGHWGEGEGEGEGEGGGGGEGEGRGREGWGSGKGRAGKGGYVLGWVGEGGEGRG